MNAAMYSSATQTWNTPEPVVDALHVFDEPGLDPCSNATSIVRAREEWRIERGENGLVRSWRGHGLVYCNPPYDELEAWAKKMAREAIMGDVETIALIPARLETKAFQQLILASCSAICFWAGRLEYGVGLAYSAQTSLFAEPEPELDTGDNTAPFPACLPYFGTRVEHFAKAFEKHGRIFVPMRWA